MLNQHRSKKNLILFTNTFPYDKGETFLEVEIKYLSHYFNHIIIFPSDKDIFIRNLPVNTVVDDSFCLSVNSGMKRMSILLKSIFFLHTRMWYLREVVAIFFTPFFSYKNLLTTFLYAKDAYRKSLVLEQYIDSHKIDVENTVFYSYWFMTSSMAMALCKKKNKLKTTITRAHQYDLYQDYPNILPFRKFISEYMNFVVPISVDGADYLYNTFDIDKNKVIVYNLGVENSRVKCRPRPKRDNTLVLLSCAFVSDRKRIWLISEALDIIVEKYSHIKLEWRHIGDGDLNTIKTILDKSDKYPSNVKVNFLGYLTNKEVIEYYDKTEEIDVFISTSAAEGKPVSFMEVQSYAIPVISTQSGGVGEIVNQENGFLLPNNATPAEIAEAIVSFLDYATLEEKRINSFKTWSEKYDAENNYGTFGEFLLNLS
jgi:glycosyltransferase involved in cell wall biosynthesis